MSRNKIQKDFICPEFGFHRILVKILHEIVLQMPSDYLINSYLEFIVYSISRENLNIRTVDTIKLAENAC